MAGKNLVADAGFLAALWTPRDQHHDWAVATARAYPPPWTACEAVLSETAHLMFSAGRATLRQAIARGAFHIAPVLAEEHGPVVELLTKYADVPMSVADGCIVRLTELLPDPLVLTTDSDFTVYRRHSRKVIPCVLP